MIMSDTETREPSRSKACEQRRRDLPTLKYSGLSDGEGAVWAEHLASVFYRCLSPWNRAAVFLAAIFFVARLAATVSPALRPPTTEMRAAPLPGLTRHRSCATLATSPFPLAKKSLALWSAPMPALSASAPMPRARSLRGCRSLGDSPPNCRLQNRRRVSATTRLISDISAGSGCAAAAPRDKRERTSETVEVAVAMAAPTKETNALMAMTTAMARTTTVAMVRH